MRMKRVPGRFAATIAIAALGLVMAGPASQAEEETDASRVADAVAAVAPDAAVQALSATTDGDVATDTAAGLTVTAPAEATDPVVVTAPFGTLEISLPNQAGVDGAEVELAADGTAVYTDGGATDVAVQALEGGVRLQTKINDATAPTSYSYEFGGETTPVLNADGSVTLMVRGDGPDLEVGQVAAAWAFDANGNAVPTHYEVAGKTLTQIVEHGDGDAYPIVADPTPSYGLYVYLHWSKSEVKTLTTSWRGSVADKMKYSAIVCTALGNAYAIGACSLYVYDMWTSVIGTFRSAAAVGKGVVMRFTYPPVMILGRWNVE